MPGDRSAAADVPATLTRVHMIGIGGAGMSAVARILLDHGVAVSGSDARDSDELRTLAGRGAVVRVGHDAAALAAAEALGDDVIVDGLGVETHDAYLLAQVDGARLWVRETLLWPPTWQEETDAVRDGFRTSLIGLLSERLGVSVEAVESAQFQPAEEAAPRVVVVELEAPEEPDGVRLLGLGLPESGMGEYGPLEYVGMEAADLPPPPESTTLGELLEASPASVEAESYVAVADDGYSLLQASNRTWRAVAGTPLWTDGSHLLATLGDDLIVYGFVAR